MIGRKGGELLPGLGGGQASPECCGWALYGEIFPVLLLPGGQEDSHRGQPAHLLVAALAQRVRLQVQGLQAAPSHGFNLHLGHEVLAGVERFELRQVCQTGGQLDERVGGEV